MSDEPAPWPVCTIKGCGHSIRWATRELRNRAIDRHRRDWTSEGNLAHCVCHPEGDFPIARFPCDQRHRSS